jgi:hypothetical protein
MASGDDKQEEEEFKDLPSEVEGDASEVGNTSAQEKFDNLKKAVKERRQEESERRRKEDRAQQARKEEQKEEGKKEEDGDHHLHHPHHHHLHLVRMEMGMMSTTAQEFPREHSSPSQNPRPCPRMIIEALAMIILASRGCFLCLTRVKYKRR